MSENMPLSDVIKTSLENIKNVIDTSTVIGEPITVLEDTVIMPVSKVSVGFASGGAEYNGKKDNIRFVHCRAEDYIVSSDETLFYFFNPFSAEIFRSVVNRILDSWQEFPRTVTLILYYPDDDSIFYLEQHTAFERFDEIAASEAIRTDRRERFSLYRLEN